MKNRLSLLPLTLLLVAGVATAQAKKVVPDADLALAQARAKVHNKRVLVFVNADGEDLAKQLKKTRGLSRTLLYEFEVVTRTVASATSKWQWRDQGGGLLVLAASGQELARFLAVDLQGVKVAEKLQPHFCKPVDAEKKLADALVLAKKTGRNVFIRFDAPW